ncbi:MAG: hypothetical protein ABIQ60_11275 [Burkholderiaceae bacterium]
MMPTPPPPPDREEPRFEPERDAWLSEALRHAPDADATPPAALREAILREARVSVNPAATPPRAPAGGRSAPRPSAFWAWLGRPPVAASFASVMMAALLGLLWWDRPIDDGALAPPQAAAREQIADRAERPAEAAKRQANERPALPEDGAAQVRSAPAQRVERSEHAREAQRAATPVDASEPQPRAPQASDHSALFADLSTAVSSQPQRWTWQRGGAAPRPMNAGLAQWLQRLDAEVAPRWQVAQEAAPATGRPELLTLYRDGVLQATLRFDENALWLAMSPAAPLDARAPLPPAAIGAWRQALDDVTR